MRINTLLSYGALLGFSFASDYVVHERRHEAIDQRWDKRESLDRSQLLPIRIGLKQSNLEHADRWLMEVSDPASPRFGQHWTADEVVNFGVPEWKERPKLWACKRTLKNEPPAKWSGYKSMINDAKLYKAETKRRFFAGKRL